MIGLLLLILGIGSAAHADSLLEVTGGVLGRQEQQGASVEETRARALVDRGSWDSAALGWAEARRAGADPELSAAWEVVSLAHADQWRVAHLAALAALARDPQSPSARLVFAWLMCEGGACRLARRVLRDYPDDGIDRVGARVLELRSWRYDGRPHRARRARRAAQAAEQTDAWFWYEAAMTSLQRGDPDALGDLERALHSQGASGGHAAVLVEVRRQLDEHEDALRLGLQAMARWPQDGSVATATARVATEPDGRQLLMAWIQGHPDDGAAHELAGALALSQELPDQAAEHLAEALELGRGTAAVYGLLADARQAQGDPAAAAVVLDQAVRAWPTHLGLIADRFELARDLGEPLQVLAAAESWRAALVGLDDPVPPPVALAAMQAALDLDRSAEALAWSELVLADRQAQPDALLARASSLARLHRGAEAVTAFEAALALVPGDRALCLAFADFLLEPGSGLSPDPKRAWGLASALLDQAALDHSASDGAAPDGAAPDGAAPDGAAPDGAAPDGAAPDDAALHELLARAAWAMGEPARAIQHQSRAVDLAPEDDRLRQGLHRYLDQESR